MKKRITTYQVVLSMALMIFFMGMGAFVGYGIRCLQVREPGPPTITEKDSVYTRTKTNEFVPGDTIFLPIDPFEK